MVAWETIEVEGQCLPALYAGLSAVRQENNNTGLAAHLYNYSMFEAQEWQRHHQQKLTIWATIATPLAFYAAEKILANTQPRLDGSFSEESAKIARAIQRRLLTGDQMLPQHPFVLPGVAIGTRYSDMAKQRIAAVCEAKRFDLFKQLGIEETKGDRLLLICEVPDVLWQPVVARKDGLEPA